MGFAALSLRGRRSRLRRERAGPKIIQSGCEILTNHIPLFTRNAKKVPEATEMKFVNKFLLHSMVSLHRCGFSYFDTEINSYVST